MVKVKRNHERVTGGLGAKSGIFIVLIGLLYAGFNFLGKNKDPEETRVVINFPEGDEPAEQADDLLLPTTHNGQVVNHRYYSLSYDEKEEQAEWVTYYISRKRLNHKRAKRTNWFEKDPLVKTGSASHKDYKGSGYDRGHMAPAADMAFEQTAMEECFFMSNMSPQVHNFNGGIWRELEEQSRDWGRMFDKLYVVTGPIFKDNLGKIGRKTQVTVPGYYYKILVDIEGPEKKAIGFVLPNAVSSKPLSVYIQTIDEIEELTGIDFFPELDDDLEDQLESHAVLEKWPMNRNLYKIRTEKWNVR